MISTKLLYNNRAAEPGHLPLLWKPLALFGSAALKPILKPILAAASSAGLKPGTPLTVLKPVWAAAVAAAAAAPTALNSIKKPALAAAAAAAGIEPVMPPEFRYCVSLLTLIQDFLVLFATV